MATEIANPTVRFGGSLGGLLGEIDKLQGRFDKFGGAAAGFGAKFLDVGAKLGGLSLAVDAAAGAIGAALSPLTDGFAGAVGLDREMGKIGTLLDDADRPFLPQLRAGIDSLARETGQSVATLSKGMYDLLSAGVPAGQALGTLRVSATAAVGGVTDVAVAVDGLTSTLNAYHLGASQATAVSDLFAATVKSGKTEFADLASSIGKVAPTASALGVELDTVLGSLAALTVQGIDTSESTTQINSLLKTFANAGDASKELAATMGVDLSAAALQGDKFKSTLEALSKLQPEVRAKFIPDFDAQKAVNALTSDLQSTFSKLDAVSLPNAAGLAQKQFESIAATADYQMGVAAAQWDGAWRDIAGSVLPILTPVTGVVAKIISRVAAIVQPFVSGFQGFVAQHVDGVVNVVTNLADRLIAGVGSFVAWVTPAVSATWDFITSNTAAAADAVGNRVNSIYDLVKAVLGGVLGVSVALWDATLGVWLGSVEELTRSSADGSSKIGDAFAAIVAAGKWLEQTVTTGLYAISYTLNHLGDAFDLMGAVIAHAVVQAGNQVEYVFSKVVPGVLTWFADNWQGILYDVANFTATVFQHIGDDVVSIFSNLPGLIAGTTDWADVWTPLTDGFEATVSELPKIADRVAGPVERALADDVAMRRQDFGQGFADYLDEQNKKVDGAIDGLKELADAQKKVADATGEAAAMKLPAAPAMPALPPAPPPADASANKIASDAAGGRGRDLSAPALLEAFSAENLAKRFGETLLLAPAAAPAPDAAAAAADAAMPSPAKDQEQQTKYLAKLYDEGKAQTRALVELGRSFANRVEKVVSIG